MTNNKQIIVGVILMVFFGLTFVLFLSMFLEAREDVKVAEQDVQNANREYQEAQNEVDAIINEGLNKQ